jgi:hypothetical protein
MSETNDELAAYLQGLIASSQSELAALEAAQASVAAEADAVRQLMVVLDDNESVREQLFRWIADRRPHVFERLAATDARWNQRLIAEIQTARVNKLARQNAIEVNGMPNGLHQ